MLLFEVIRMNCFSLIRKHLRAHILLAILTYQVFLLFQDVFCSCNKFSPGMDFHQKSDILQQCVGLGDISWTKSPFNIKGLHGLWLNLW